MVASTSLRTSFKLLNKISASVRLKHIGGLNFNTFSSGPSTLKIIYLSLSLRREKIKLDETLM